MRSLCPGQPVPNVGAHHKDSGFRRLARLVTVAANANPNTRCWRCRRTLDHCGPRGNRRNANGTPCTWHAGHTIAGDNNSPVLAECSHCNCSTQDADTVTEAAKIAAAQRWRG